MAGPERDAAQKSGPQAAATPRDLTPGDHDVPPFNLGGQDMYAISPDGQEVAYTSNIDEVEATSTNNEIFVVPISGGNAKKISTSPGADTTPLYSPDGKYLAWRSQARAGFEADKWRLFVQDRQSDQTRDLTENFDRSVGSFAWEPNSKRLAFAAEDHGGAPVFAVSVGMETKPAGGGADALHADDLVFSGDVLFFTRMSARAPNEIWREDPASKDEIGTYSLDSFLKPVTHMNDALLSQIDMQPLESFTFKGANDEEVQGFMVKPPGIRSEQKVSAEISDPRRAAGRVGKFVDISMERGVVRGERKLRGGNDQFPRFDRLWAEIYRLDQRRLGRQTVCRSDEGARLRGENVSVYR